MNKRTWDCQAAGEQGVPDRGVQSVTKRLMRASGQGMRRREGEADAHCAAIRA